MYSVYTHKANGCQLFLNKKEFFSNFDINDARAFLKQVEDSFWEADKCRPRGAFYSRLRYCFAEIDMLGKLYKGEVGTQNMAENSIIFMKKYFGNINKRYRKLSGLIIDMHRHGLMHTHMIKQIKLNNGNVLGWELQDTESGDEHLKLKKVDHGFNIVINVYQFIKDSLDALEKYETDLTKKVYLNRFKKGYFGMAVAFDEPVSNQTRQSQRRQRMVISMKPYSYDGIKFLKEEMK